jgi:hypothetical protein
VLSFGTAGCNLGCRFCGVLPRRLRRPPPVGARHARLPQEPDQRLAGDHHAADPGPERLRRRAGAPDGVGGGEPGAGRAAALHGLPPRLPPPRPAADAAGDIAAGAADRAGERAALRLRRQRPRRGGRQHPLPRLRCAVDRPRLVRADALGPGRSGPLPGLRHALPRRLRGRPGRLGRAAGAGAPRAARTGPIGPQPGRIGPGFQTHPPRRLLCLWPT